MKTQDCSKCAHAQIQVTMFGVPVTMSCAVRPRIREAPVRLRRCRWFAGRTQPWTPFFFESNQFFGTIRGTEDWSRLRAAYPSMSDAELLDAREATYAGTRPQEERDARPNYGLRHEHDGDRTLRDFFATNGMSLEDKP